MHQQESQQRSAKQAHAVLLKHWHRPKPIIVVMNGVSFNISPIYIYKDIKATFGSLFLFTYLIC